MSDDDELFHARLRTALDAYTALAAQRRTHALSVSKLIAHQKTRTVLCELTGQSDPDLACQHARRLMGRPDPDSTAPSARSAAPPIRQPAPRRAVQRRAPKPSATTAGRASRGAKPNASTSASGGPRPDAQSLVACVVCRQPLPARLAARRLTVHPSCRPVPCRGCHRAFPRTALVNWRCPACSRKPTPRHRKVAGSSAAGRARKLTPMEQANRARQAAQRHEAERLAKLPRRSGCAVCGNHGDHQCGRQWRLADGQIGKRPRGKGRGSVWTVRGGLPSLGKRSH